MTMIPRRPINVDRLRELLAYDPETGVFTWKVRRNQYAEVGSIAGTPHHGYLTICFDNVIYQAHRLAWAYVHGSCPDHLDHRDAKDKMNNRISNLRPCTQRTNNQNRSAVPTKALAKGVSRVNGCKTPKWRARISVDGRSIWLGVFATEQEAHAAYVAAATLHFGEFARAA